ncbi:MAG: YncE family protein [Sphingomonadaceae bacterium]
MKQRGRTISWALALWCAASLSSAAIAAISGLPKLICGIENIEDLVALPHSPWLIGSNMGNAELQNGGFFLIDTRTDKVSRVPLDFSPAIKTEAPYDQCPAPPTAAFSSQGLGLKQNRDGTATLFAVSHGGRQAIEVFRVSYRAKAPAIRWIGCIMPPPFANMNSVAPRADGSVVMSAAIAGEVPMVQTPQGMLIRPDIKVEDLTGGTFLWTRAEGWREISAGKLKLNNGVVLSRDEQWAFVASWSQRSVTYLPLDPSRGGARTIPLGFNPDNLRWTADGKIAAAGHVGYTMQQVSACVLSNNPHCALNYAAAEIDPRRFTVTQLYNGKGTHDFGMATVALKTRNAVWLGSARSTCLGKLKLHR